MNAKILTKRELELLQLFHIGHTYKSAGRQLGITNNTVKNHSKSIYTKLGCISKLEAINAYFGKK